MFGEFMGGGGEQQNEADEKSKEFQAQIDGMTDKEFEANYAEDGFGWMDSGNEAAVIGARWKRIREKNPKAMPQSAPYASRSTEMPQGPDVRDLKRNLDGQYVDPGTGKPVERGSRLWNELGQRNAIPLNQEDERRKE